jgi:hypothetical protein
MARKDSISMQMVHEALCQSRLDGPRRERLLADAGIALAQLRAPTARVSVQAYGRLWRRLARAQDDEFFGMDTRPLRAGSFAFMSRMAVAQPTLAAALDACLAFLGLMLEGLPARLQRQGDRACVAFDDALGHARRPFTYFTYWLIVQGLASWLVDRRLPIVALELRCAAPADCTDYQALFNAPLRFGQAQSRLLLAAECLQWPVRRSVAEVEHFLARAPDNILVRYRDPDSLAQRVRLHLRGLARLEGQCAARTGLRLAGRPARAGGRDRRAPGFRRHPRFLQGVSTLDRSQPRGVSPRAAWHGPDRSRRLSDPGIVREAARREHDDSFREARACNYRARCFWSAALPRALVRPPRECWWRRTRG